MVAEGTEVAQVDASVVESGADVAVTTEESTAMDIDNTTAVPEAASALAEENKGVNQGN